MKLKLVYKIFCNSRWYSKLIPRKVKKDIFNASSHVADGLPWCLRIVTKLEMHFLKVFNHSKTKWASKYFFLSDSELPANWYRQFSLDGLHWPYCLANDSETDKWKIFFDAHFAFVWLKNFRKVIPQLPSATNVFHNFWSVGILETVLSMCCKSFATFFPKNIHFTSYKLELHNWLVCA